MKPRTHSRREFLGLTTAGIVAAGVPRYLRAASIDEGDSDLIVRNANIYTVDPGQPKAEAFAVRGGRFVAVGTTSSVPGPFGPAFRRRFGVKSQRYFRFTNAS